MKSIGLCMIVKNEARVILRCLESVRPLVDYVLVEDTGSTDGTQDIIRTYLHREGLPGEVFDEPWRDFAHNRTVALERLREVQGVDYALVMDADDVLVFDEGFDAAAFKRGLAADLYSVWFQLGGVRYFRPQLYSNRLSFSYRGILHEFLESPPGCTTDTATGIHIFERREGARSQDPDKYHKDARLLEQALNGEQDPFLRARYTFYLAQSWRDYGEAEKALAAYLARADLGFWDEEVFMSLYNAAQLKEKLGHPEYEIIGTYLRAHESCPSRAEPLHGAARYCRIAGKFHQGYLFAKQALQIPQPAGGLFIETWVYDYGLLDEIAVNAYWTGRYRECLDACQCMLSGGKMPEDMRERVEKNAEFAEAKLPAQTEVAQIPVNSGSARSIPNSPIFIHATWRTGSTWFWGRFRKLPETMCFFEPFTELLETLSPSDATLLDHSTWNNRHPVDDPYFAEYLPFLRKAGGIRLFKSEIPYEWFIPIGGLGGDLRAAEERYLAMLIRAAEQQARVPVLGFTRSLGRIAAIKKAFAGLHIFQFRSLIKQWCSYLHFKRDGGLFFHRTLAQIVARCDDPFFSYLSQFYLRREISLIAVEKMDATTVSTHSTADALFDLPENDAFAMFMAMHIYLYLNAMLVADICVDVSRMEEDEQYRVDIEADIKVRSGLEVSFADVRDEGFFPADVGFELDAVNWGEIRDHCRVASRFLSRIADPEALIEKANVFIDDAFAKAGFEQAGGGGSSDPEAEKSKTSEPAIKSEHTSALSWQPDRPQGGTELMVDELRRQIGSELQNIDLRINMFSPPELTGKPLIVWIHHDINQDAVQWCRNPELVSRVHKFIFVSHWQLDRFCTEYSLPADKCIVLPNATWTDAERRAWEPAAIRQIAYTSTPFRGLSVLLDAWELLSPADAVLNIWSSMKLYGPLFDDTAYRELFDRAGGLPNTHYHGIVPNAELRRLLRSIDYLAYPSVFPETSCISVIEAMAAGCRVICPALGALPETTAGFARIYDWPADPATHAKIFCEILKEELSTPWGGMVDQAEAEQDYCRQFYDWSVRSNEWKHLLNQMQS